MIEKGFKNHFLIDPRWKLSYCYIRESTLTQSHENFLIFHSYKIVYRV